MGDDALYNMVKRKQLLEWYNEISWKNDLENENIRDRALNLVEIWNITYIFYKDHTEKLTAPSLPLYLALYIINLIFPLVKVKLKIGENKVTELAKRAGKASNICIMICEDIVFSYIQYYHTTYVADLCYDSGPADIYLVATFYS